MRALDDVKFAFRLMRKSPAFTAVALAALALGIGANSAMFSVVNAILYRPLPYPSADRIGIIWQKSPGQGWNRINPSGPDFVDMKQQSRSFEQMAALEVGSGTVTGFGEPQQVPGMRVSTNLLSLLGVKPLLGRDFAPGGGFKDHVALISHASWLKWFGGDPSVVGRRLLVDGLSYTLIGVLPQGAELPIPADAFVPWSDADLRGQNRMDHRFTVLARLKPGVTWKQASAELDAVQRHIADTVPRMKDWSAFVAPFQDWLSQRARPALLLLLAAVGLVLLIACTNLANLMLARAAGRERDVAVRMALGANRSILMRQFLVETLVLGVLGGALGLLLAYWGVDALDGIVPHAIRMPDSNADFIRPKIVIDGTVLAFTAAVALLSGLLFGLAPAIAASRASLNNILRQRGSSSGKARGLRDGLVIAEIALALVLLVAATLTMQSFWNIQKVQPGFASDHLLVLETELPTDSKYRTDPEQVRFYDRVLQNLSELPGVVAVGMSNALPMDEADSKTDFRIEGRPLPPSGQLLSANYRSVSEDYFTAMRIPLKTGRVFSVRDTVDRPRVAIIDTVTAQRYFTDGLDPIGQKIRMGNTVAEIVGIVGEVRNAGLDKQPEPTIYTYYRQAPRQQVRFVLRHPTAASMVSAAKHAIYAVDKDQPLYNIRTMQEIVEGSQSGSRLILILLGLFAGIALVLASLGIYGVVSYAVTQRTGEIGIRMALGAGVGEVMRMVLGQGLKLTFAGLAAGLFAALAVSRLLASLLYGVHALDPLVLGVTALLLGAVAMAATFFPALRAARTNPVVSLRYE
jgi:putative ABC transport system permease protein